MTKATLPYGGYLRWSYYTAGYNGTRSQREVQTRIFSKDGVSERTFSLGRASDDPTRTSHSYAEVIESGGNSKKKWWFGPLNQHVLLTEHDILEYPVERLRVQETYTWTLDGGSNPYMGTTVTTLEAYLPWPW